MTVIFKTKPKGALLYYFLPQAVLTEGGKVTQCYPLGRVSDPRNPSCNDAKDDQEELKLWMPVKVCFFLSGSL